MTIPVRDATADDLPTAARTLAAAFEDYPWTRWSVPAANHIGRLEELQGIYLRHALGCGLVLVDDALRGVAALLPPDAPEPSGADQERIADLLGDRLDALLAAALPRHPEGSWELATLGVRPNSRGGGVGSALLTEGLRRLDSSRATVSLETSRERNLALYGRHGFTVTATTQIPGGPVVHSMLRAPVSV
ncbi:GNAT family N-acetyltransferase [Brachybacterium sp. YJGR34]|uniref:GNAT family N-acetyltransferase n=1 Tax=Brachybacterium sp. YJGR34 TaxID=2059911 RepID=UPI0018E65E24|nr:GNAT family N-acetyltransferase [Brachybacterium sp. YJGR34]